MNNLTNLLQEQKKYARDAFAKLPIYPETETTKAIQITNTFLDTLLTTAITKGYELALEEVEKEMKKKLEYVLAQKGKYDDLFISGYADANVNLDTHIAHLKKTI